MCIPIVQYNETSLMLHQIETRRRIERIEGIETVNTKGRKYKGNGTNRVGTKVRVMMYVQLSRRELVIQRWCDEIESEKRWKMERTTKARIRTNDESGNRSGKQ